MPPRFHRMTAPRVVHGTVQRQNRTLRSADVDHTVRDAPAIHRGRPGPGYRHVLQCSDITRFIELLPEWPELSRGLNAIVLDEGREDCDGWYSLGVVGICAWEREMVREVDTDWHQDHLELLDRLGVIWETSPEAETICQFTESSIRAYQLLHVFLHELGHHHDLMTSRRRKECGRGEGHAEQYAYRHESLIWDRYLEAFGLY